MIRSDPCSRIRAFSLIELLVVIAIIALLLAVLLPSLKKARAEAKKVVCGTHMRTLLQAGRGYANDSNGRVAQPGWLSIDKRILGSKGNAAWLYSPWPWPSTNMKNGVFWPYVLDAKVYRCPSHRGPYWGTARMTSFLSNGSICHWGRRRYKMFKYVEFKPQDAIYYEGDEKRNNWNDSSNVPWEGVSSRHLFGSNIGNVDASVNWMTWREIWDEHINVNRRTRFWNVPGTSKGK